MGKTTFGLPYPDDTDVVREGALNMKMLAESIDQEPVELELTRNTSAFTAVSGAWTKLQWSGVSYDHRSDGLNSQNGGILVNHTGRVYVEVSAMFPASAGRKGIGVGDLAGTGPFGHCYVIEEHVVSNLHFMKASFSLSIAGGHVLAAFIYQQSGASITMSTSSTLFMVRRLRGGQKHA